MLTTPLTTPHFHDRVMSTLADHLVELENHPSKSIPIPKLHSLSLKDTLLGPDELVSQLLAIASPWIDLSSPDPVVYDISCQVLRLEIAYAAFCGIGNIILPTPRLHHGKLHGDGIVRYAHAVQDALSVGHYINISVSLSMMDRLEDENKIHQSDLAVRAQGRYMALSENDNGNGSAPNSEEHGNPIQSGGSPAKKASRYDSFGTWDAWNVIRTICNYNNRLFVGKKYDIFLSLNESVPIYLFLLLLLIILWHEARRRWKYS